jgi:hypothetical protein
VSSPVLSSSASSYSLLHVCHYLSFSRFLLSLIIDHFRADRSSSVVILLPPIYSYCHYILRELYIYNTYCFFLNYIYKQKKIYFYLILIDYLDLSSPYTLASHPPPVIEAPGASKLSKRSKILRGASTMSQHFPKISDMRTI